MRNKENTGFDCEYCGEKVYPLSNGSYRNHCPTCLYSKHVDNTPGDRKSTCGALMLPIDLIYTGNKGYQIVHQCSACKKVQKNKIAEDTIQPDQLFNWAQLQQ